MERITPQYLKKKKEKGEKVTLLTAYDYITSRIEDEAGIDVILIGDSYGTTVLGHSSTLPVTMEDMVPVVGAVRRGAKKAMVIADMPYLSYQPSIECAIRNAGRFMRQGVDGIKLEGGLAMQDTVKRLVDIGIPVMGHIGMTPQSYRKFGGYRVRGKREHEFRELLKDAGSLEDAGVFSIIVECVPEKVARKITEKLKIPVYGIGAGKYCDGQILVVTDMLGLLSGETPKFVKEYAHLRDEIRNAINKYIDEVKNGIYPDANHTYS